MVKTGDLDVPDSQSGLECPARDGESPVTRRSRGAVSSSPVLESCSLGMLHQLGGSLLLKLNMDWRPIANKYCEGKMKTTTEVELKELKPLYGKRTKSTLIAVLLSLANVETQLATGAPRGSRRRRRC